MSNCEDISHKPYIQRHYIPVASAKQVFKKEASILLTCTHLLQNIDCVKWTMSAIRGNISNLLPLQYIHINFHPIFSLQYTYRQDTGDYILSLKFSKSIWNHNRGGVHPISLCSMLLLSHHTAAVSKTLHKNVYWNVIVNTTHMYKSTKYVLTSLQLTYESWVLGVAYICLVKLFYIFLLLFTSIILQYNSTVNAYPLRFLPDWNPVTEVMITIRTTDIDTVHSPDTAHIQHLQNWT